MGYKCINTLSCFEQVHNLYTYGTVRTFAARSPSSERAISAPPDLSDPKRAQ